MIMEKIAKRSEVSNAWNFDFDDDDESDRADVAAFEYADSPTRGQDSALVSQAHAENFGEHEYDFNKFRTIRSADFDSNRPGVGFDDFDDEDDVGSYEIDTPNNYSVRKATSNDFSEAEGFFETEDIESSDNNFRGQRRAAPRSNNKPSKLKRQRPTFSDFEDDQLDFELIKSFQHIPTGSLVMLLNQDIEVEVEVQQVRPGD
ncbi:hypothetical protein ACOSP7_008731 [Xanthoceras sorbifolium]